ncbi:Sel1 repeat-containing protein [Roseomonas rosea]|uniref:Sel1 repeat-containing protein n=1 Tax=Muricoccus roseus TaxID=198092 RepID=A0A1M6E0Y8_9PROT|nr:tetratricopeptide repeat protein [Roseomonas rosea]SHI79136.1 Sel1 repeat-containing protein [Roseomonas rosea]
MKALRLAALAAGIGLAGCVQPGGPPGVVVCPPGAPCRVQPVGMVTSVLEEGPARPREPEVGDSLRGLAAAAESGVPDAQYRLATLLFRGTPDTPRQSYAALQWMRRAGEGGDVRAQRAVGRLYMTGLEEMGQDLQEARRWLGMAAGQGDRQARRDLAEIDRAERQERDFQRALALKQAETRSLWIVVVPVAVYR